MLYVILSLAEILLKKKLAVIEDYLQRVMEFKNMDEVKYLKMRNMVVNEIGKYYGLLGNICSNIAKNNCSGLKIVNNI